MEIVLPGERRRTGANYRGPEIASTDTTSEQQSDLRPPNGKRLAFSAAFFSFATGLSRVAGLVREMVAAAYFGLTAAASAFTMAFVIPNTVRALFADAALQAAFVPVFTELLDKGNRREAFRVASTMFYLMLLGLGALTVLFILLAPQIVSLLPLGFTDPVVIDLTVHLTQLMFPIVVMLGVTGLFVGILNAYDHFEIPAIAPLFWNFAIIICLVGLVPVFSEADQIYAYAIGILVGTLVQMLMPLPLVRKKAAGERFGRAFDLKNPHVRRICKLMLPVTFTLGLINFNLLINNIVGSRVGDFAPAAIDKAFRIYMLPQGMFSVAIATILFPTLSRLAANADYAGVRATMANGIRQMFMLLLPAAVASAVLAVPIIRLVFERGKFGPGDTEIVAGALFWFAWSLPFSGANLLFARTFFALQRPWITTVLSVVNLAVNLILAILLYEPYGVDGVVVATVVATIVLTLTQAIYLRGPLGGIDGRATASAVLKMCVAGGLLAIVSYLTWYVADDLAGRTTAGQIVSIAIGLGSGVGAYAATAYAMGIEEARQIAGMFAGRLRRS